MPKQVDDYNCGVHVLVYEAYLYKNTRLSHDNLFTVNSLSMERFRQMIKEYIENNKIDHNVSNIFPLEGTKEDDEGTKKRTTLDEPQSEASQSSEKQKTKKTPLNDNATTPIRNIGHNAMASSSATKIVGNDTNDDVKKNKIKLSVIPEEMVQTSQLVKENIQRITESV